MNTEALIQALLATGTMNEETSADLGRWLEEFKAGTLHPDDAEYIAALHARVTGDPSQFPASEAVSDRIAEAERFAGLDSSGGGERALVP